MALVIPDEMEEDFRGTVIAIMAVERDGGGGSDYQECSFCGNSGRYIKYSNGKFEPIEHDKTCLGVQLLALESVEVEECSKTTDAAF